MTREEAIKYLERADITVGMKVKTKTAEAIEMAIKALEQEQKTGHWVEENVNGGGRRVFCSECGCPPPFEHISTGDVYSASGYGVINKTKFCPSCGIKMESEVMK